MRLAGRNDDNAAGSNIDLAPGTPEGCLTLEHDEYLGVLMSVKRRTPPRRGISVEE